MTPTLIVICMIVCVTVSAVVYLTMYFWLRHLHHKEPHHDPLEAVDQPTKRGHLHWGYLGKKHHDEYRKGKE